MTAAQLGGSSAASGDVAGNGGNGRWSVKGYSLLPRRKGKKKRIVKKIIP